jgi:hypothetical protein
MEDEVREKEKDLTWILSQNKLIAGGIPSELG